MRALVFLLVPLACFIIGFYLGSTFSARQAQPKKLANPEREELKALRSFKNDARKIAASHTVLDSNLAIIILDEVDKVEERISNDN